MPNVIDGLTIVIVVFILSFVYCVVDTIVHSNYHSRVYNCPRKSGIDYVNRYGEGKHKEGEEDEKE